jgi:hypothetical protein
MEKYQDGQAQPTSSGQGEKPDPQEHVPQVEQKVRPDEAERGESPRDIFL